MEVKMMSTEMIKPASPTSPQSRFYNLSLIDQISPHLFFPLILYYPRQQMGAAATSADLCRRLKTSLSHSLVWFYPLAGKLVVQENHIDCNDQGVEFYETRVLNCRLDELLKKKPVESLADLIASGSTCIKYSGKDDALMVVQANFFDCGGLALAVSLNHLIGDMASLANFLNSWASTAREVRSPAKTPFVVHQDLFPPARGTPRQLSYPFASNLKIVRFVTDVAKIATLQQKRKSSEGAVPTRVEAITALVCRCMARATRTQLDGKEDRGFIVFHSVNIRRRLEPPLPDDTFGNFLFLSVTMQDGSLAGDEYGNLEKQLRHNFNNINGALGRELQWQERCDKAMKAIKDAMQKIEEKEMEGFIFSSWRKFPYYEVDFGWGRPEWVSPATIPVKNGCIFMDQKEGDGVEVWVSMEADQMTNFEDDKEWLSYVS